ncbi:hypothetical protein SUGI_0443790 [Cryptomeria japonica]|nr:hypothetical protein SUGI_0443790 [Cryptomeria japonica]
MYQEKNGGLCKINRGMLDFSRFAQKTGATDYIPKTGWYTWTNKRISFTNIAYRLDHFLIGPQSTLDSTTLTTTLPYVVSDHYPVQLEIEAEQKWGNGYLKFENIWWREKTLLDTLEAWWNERKLYKSMPSFCISKRL